MTTARETRCLKAMNEAERTSNLERMWTHGTGGGVSQRRPKYFSCHYGRQLRTANMNGRFVITMAILASQHCEGISKLTRFKRQSVAMSAAPELNSKTTAADVAQLFGGNVRGKVAVVTGGNSGIGLETVRILAGKCGCKLVVYFTDPIQHYDHPSN